MNFTWNNSLINTLFGEVRHLQGKLAGEMLLLGFSQRKEKQLETITFDVVKSAEMEGIQTNYGQVRSSVARHLGMDTAGLAPSGRNVESIVEMMLDAMRNFRKPLTEERLFGWHAALCPADSGGMYKTEKTKCRTGKIQAVSDANGREKALYGTLPAKDVKAGIDRFLCWLNEDNDYTDNVLRSAIAHFRFMTLRPFDNGNERIAQAISNMLLARSENTPERFYSLSKQILAKRADYYEILKKTKHRRNDITEWLAWFLNCLKHALLETEDSLQNISIFNNIHPALHMEAGRNIRDEIVSALHKIDENNLSDANSEATVKTCLQLILALNSKVKAEQPAGSEPDRFRQLIENHFLKERSVSFYAGCFAVTSSTFSKKIKKETGKTPSQLIRERVVLEAKKLLHLTSKSVKEIAFELNFEDEFYFSRYFKKSAGMSPSHYRGKTGTSVKAKLSMQ